MEMLTRRPIMLTNLATVFVGMGLYFAFLGLTQFVQIPHERSGIRLRGDRAARPASSTCCRARSPAFWWRLVSGRFIDRFGARPVLVDRRGRGHRGLPVHRAGSLMRRGRSSRPASWPTPTSAWVTARCPRWWSREVDAGETGVATSMNAIARTVGSSTAAALVAVLLGRTIRRHPAADGEQLHRDLRRRRSHRGAGDGADRVVAPAERQLSNPSRRDTNLVP